MSRNGNRSQSAAPQGAYSCQRDDQWCAIAVETDEHWVALGQAIGDSQWASHQRFQTNEGRLANHDEIDAELTRWTSTKTPQEAMRILIDAGVPAGVVQRSSDLQKDPQLAHRNFFRPLDHQEMGTIPYPGHQFKIRGYESGPRSAAPVLGQHNDFVLQEILGMTGDEITDAIVGGALG